MRSPMISEFGKRARLYAALDCRLAAHTRFFGAARILLPNPCTTDASPRFMAS
jgi:hypothetical protein